MFAFDEKGTRKPDRDLGRADEVFDVSLERFRMKAMMTDVFERNCEVFLDRFSAGPDRRGRMVFAGFPEDARRIRGCGFFTHVPRHHRRDLTTGATPPGNSPVRFRYPAEVHERSRKRELKRRSALMQVPRLAYAIHFRFCDSPGIG